MLPGFRLAALVATVLAAVTAAPAQCGFQWRPGPRANGPAGTGSALLELPNGELIAGGRFAVADATFTNGVARWNGTTWQPLGGGFSGLQPHVFALARLPNGDLVAGGEFTRAGGVAAANIARWNGSTWQPLGTGLDQPVQALQVLPNGDLVATGSFRFAGGVYVRGFARWDGVSWTPFDNSISVFAGLALALLPNGDLVAGIDSFQGQGVVRWTGTTWQPLPGLDPTGNLVQELAVLPNGHLALAGLLRIGGAVRRIAVFDGVTMTPYDPPLVPDALLAASNGDLVVGGNVGGTDSVFRYDGTAWQPLAGGPATVQVLLEDAAGNVVAGGRASPQTGIGAVARRSAGAWHTLGASMPPEVLAAVRLPDGDVVVGGRFDALQGVAVQNLARWNGTTWGPVSGGVDGRVTSLAVAPDGDLVVGGEFTSAGGAPANRVARWNGQTWTTLGAGLSGAPTEIGADANGRVLAFVVGGLPATSVLHEFSGGVWAPAPLTVGTSLVRRIVALPNGGFALAGLFTSPAGLVGLVLYDNGVTTPLPSPIPGAAAAGLDALVDTTGDLVAITAGVRRWDGVNWSLLSAATPQRIAQLPDGTIIGGGAAVTVGGERSGLFRMTANGAEPFGDVNGRVVTLACSAAGELVLGGEFSDVVGQVSLGFAQARPTCASAVTTFGAGCVGSA